MLYVDQNFFVSILVDLQEKLHKRCVSLSGTTSVNNYTELADLFNSTLAGKFPFVEDPCSEAPDAEPEQIRAFFEMMDDQSANIKATLLESKGLGGTGQAALAFIEQMDALRSFYGGYLAAGSTIPEPTFGLDVTFRVNKEREERANEILKWELMTQDTIIDMRSKSKKGLWKADDPISMTFQWANNSPLRPTGGDEPNYSVQGEDAVFAYGGTWGLIKMLRLHQATASDFDSLNDEQPITLRFDVPLTNVVTNSQPADGPLKATAFVRLVVSPIKKKPAKAAPPTSGTPTPPAPAPAKPPKITTGKPVTLPFFPQHAPKLSTGGH